MLYLVVLEVTVATTMPTMPTEETSIQATSVETVALLLVTMVMVALEEMPSAVRFHPLHGSRSFISSSNKTWHCILAATALLYD